MAATAALSRSIRATARKLGSTVGSIIAVRVGTIPVGGVVAGAAADGNAAVTVTVNGNDIPAPYLAAYATPTAGHVVLVLLINNSPVILGRIIGLPVV